MGSLTAWPLQEIQQWDGCSHSRIAEEYAPQSKPEKGYAYKQGCAPFNASSKVRSTVRGLRIPNSKSAREWAKVKVEDANVRGLAIPVAAVSTEARFREFADEWLQDTRAISSVTDLTSHPKYRQIVHLGWSVIPYLLSCLWCNWPFSNLECTKL